MPSEEEPSPSEFAAYPRPEKPKRKDPDPIPSDRWLARIGGVVCVASFLSGATSRSTDPGVKGMIEVGTMAVILAAYFVVGRGYRVGFGIVTFLGLFQFWGIYLLWSHGLLFHKIWLTHLLNLYMVLFTLYCVARYFGLWPRTARSCV